MFIVLWVVSTSGKNGSSVDGLMFYQTLPSHMKSAACGYLTGLRLPGI